MEMSSFESPQTISGLANSFVSSDLNKLSSEVIDGNFECFLGSEEVTEIVKHFSMYIRGAHF